ncbi:MAG: hypothetical protein ASARMPREDX12_004542 [Alectoria sarmentosa]|nr:MAG: hypothetical protein ASARMPREDX12_004542 [Alectoria sarmentosa]
MPTRFQPSLAKTYLAIQSLLLLLSTTASPITNITTPILTLPINDIGIQCTKAQTWVAGGFHRSDCLGIIDYIWKNEALKRESQDYEFTSLGATAKTDLPKIVTPRKYEYRTCVVTIAMLDRFQPRELPGSDFRERYEETDVAKFEGVWSAAVTVDFNCGRFGKAGWVVMGEQESIGVLIMTSGSAEDRNIPDGPPSGFITLPNGTNLVESSGR